MKTYTVTYNVWGTRFEYKTTNAYELYNAVVAVVKANKIMYPDQDGAFNEYLVTCADIVEGRKLAHINHIFEIKAEEKEE